MDQIQHIVQNMKPNFRKLSMFLSIVVQFDVKEIQFLDRIVELRKLRHIHVKLMMV